MSTLTKDDAVDLFNSSGTDINSKEDAVDAFNNYSTPVEKNDPNPSTITKLKNKLTKIVTPVTDSTDNWDNEIETAKDVGSDVLDLAKLYGQGRAFGLADEIGGVISAGVDKVSDYFDPTNSKLKELGFKLEDPSFGDRYRQNQQMIQKDIEESEKRHPVAGTLANIAGSFQTGGKLGEAALDALGIGGEAAAGSQGAKRLMDIYKNEGKMQALGEGALRGVKGFGKTLPTMIPEIASYSKEGGILTPEERQKLLEDEIGGLTFGAVTQGTLHGTGEIGKGIAKGIGDSVGSFTSKMPVLRQGEIAREYGLQGRDLKSEAELLRTKLGTNPSPEELKLAAANPEILNSITEKQVMGQYNEIKQAKKQLGEYVQQSVDNSNKIINIDNTIAQPLQNIQIAIERFPEIVNNKKLKDAYSKLTSGSSDLTPRNIKDVIDGLGDSIASFGGNPTSTENAIRQSLIDVQKSLNNKLKIEVPEYAQSAERYSNFMRLVPETIMAGETPVDIQGKFYNDYDNAPLHIYENLFGVNTRSTDTGRAVDPIRQSFSHIISGRKDFDLQEAERLARGEIKSPVFQNTAETLESQIKSNSDSAIARNSIDELNPHSGMSSIPKIGLGFGGTTKSMYLGLNNKLGLAQKRMGEKATNNLGFTLFNAPSETHLQLANKLKTIPSLASYGDSLEKAITSGDQNKKNKALFIIMQNPTSRLLLGEGTEESNDSSYTPQP